jgi:hypothetical protein
LSTAGALPPLSSAPTPSAARRPPVAARDLAAVAGVELGLQPTADGRVLGLVGGALEQFGQRVGDQAGRVLPSDSPLSSVVHPFPPSAPIGGRPFETSQWSMTVLGQRHVRPVRRAGGGMAPFSTHFRIVWWVTPTQLAMSAVS